MTILLVVTVLGIAWVVGTNELDDSNDADYEYVTVLGELAMVVGRIGSILQIGNTASESSSVFVLVDL
jgi:hypothetical protein